MHPTRTSTVIQFPEPPRPPRPQPIIQRLSKAMEELEFCLLAVGIVAELKIKRENEKEKVR